MKHRLIAYSAAGLWSLCKSISAVVAELTSLTKSCCTVASLFSLFHMLHKKGILFLTFIISFSLRVCTILLCVNGDYVDLCDVCVCVWNCSICMNIWMFVWCISWQCLFDYDFMLLSCCLILFMHITVTTFLRALQYLSVLVFVCVCACLCVCAGNGGDIVCTVAEVTAFKLILL